MTYLIFFALAPAPAFAFAAVFVFRLRWFYFVRGLLGATVVTCDGLSQRIAASQGEERAAYRARPPRTPMTVDERKEWSRQGGRAALVFGLARRWTSETARAANAKRTMPGSSRMAKTGRLGGLERLALTTAAAASRSTRRVTTILDGTDVAVVEGAGSDVPR